MFSICSHTQEEKTKLNGAYEHWKTSSLVLHSYWALRGVSFKHPSENERRCGYMCLRARVCVCLCCFKVTNWRSLSFYAMPLLCDEWFTRTWHLIGGSHVRCSSEGWLCDWIYACSCWTHKHRMRVARIYKDQARALCVYGVFLTFRSICCSTARAAMQAHCFQEHMCNNHLQRQEGQCDLEH